jgi:hypothetical protein
MLFEIFRVNTSFEKHRRAPLADDGLFFGEGEEES